MDVLGSRLPLADFISAFIVLVFFSASAAAFMNKRSLWFTWLLFSVGGLGGAWTPYDIKKYLISGLKLLKKVESISNGKATSCGSASFLKRNRV